MKVFIKSVIAGFLLLGCAAKVSQQSKIEEKQTAKPNILVILCDDLGYNDVGFNGSKDIITPNIDKLAAAGTVMTSAYVAHPFCGPSRSGFITGRYPQITGTPYNLSDENTHQSLGVSLNETFMSTTLQDAGYYTGIIGKWHLGFSADQHPNKRGFDNFFGFLGGGHKYFPEEYKKAYNSQLAQGKKREDMNVYLTPIEHNGKDVDEKEYITDAFSRESVNMINDAAGKKQPFFLYLSYNAPHAPMEATKEDLKVFENITDSKRRTYAAMVYSVDRGVGKIVQALKDNGQLENTLIVFMSDNGAEPNHGGLNAPLKGVKGDTWEGGFRVPMLMHWPAKIPAGKHYDHPVTALDLYPTFADMANAPLTKGKKLDGKNILKDVIAGSDVRKNEMIYTVRYRGGYCDIGGRLGDWKVTRMGNKSWQLFNIKEDIGETKDLTKQFPERLKSMVADIENWSRSHVTPLWFYTEKDKEMWNDGRLPGYKKAFSDL